MAKLTIKTSSTAGVLIALAFMLSIVAAWVTNIIWTFHQTETVKVILGLVGAVVAPLGIMHGFYIWF